MTQVTNIPTVNTTTQETPKTSTQIESELASLKKEAETLRISEIRQRVENLTFFAPCKELLKSYLIIPTDDSKKLLISEIKKIVKPSYFMGLQSERTYGIEVEKSGRICAYVFQDNKPVIGSDSLPLIKTKEVAQYLGLLIKHNGYSAGLISELFKLDEIKPADKTVLDTAKIHFSQVESNFEKVLDSFNSTDIPVTIGYITVITINQDGKKTYKQKPVLGTGTIDETKGVVKRFSMHNRIKEKEVANAAKLFLSEAKKGLKTANKK